MSGICTYSGHLTFQHIFFEYLKLMLQTILIIIRPLFLASDNYASVVTYFPALHLGS
ncbi:hypothetical protein YPPY13_1158 [Yersinia pestis PY-13]|uniref:Uncharacterized protein n=3 Tax=Yersinia pseudotuberculosis complex TaxID=1649845 RepID=A0A0H3B0D5_YERPY|nr:hypothetical protein YPIP275_4438 [Yersinia pestis biovar Orientalis str. IP275]EDR43025.1 hypothetical protein YpE1979001_3505 [Yersinia pestis biovar Antiqua str. E1979001]EDR50579.1 hypothetical protein YpB42003004_3003 [Yersinia pestis biovar Antiqua str. B42003004]EDR56108.1 hypothetical protein YpMG051020_3823 [Yersinia pestis biovar Orientalis str. MG05-1020]EEO91350.1 hypothetical protein YPS_1577 [Yersinia pestis Pestoides A]EIQ92776.1 hypothetical protein YPPY01_1063 [Yersinia pes